MKITTIVSTLLLLLISSCSSMKQFRYMNRAKAPKGSFRAEIPFEYRNNWIIIKTKLNGSDKEYEFVLDSGAPCSVIYQEAFEDTKPDTVMTYGISDTQGNRTKSVYVLLDMKLGNYEFKDVFTAYTKPNDVIKCLAPGGIIGADLMQTVNWEIDFKNQKIIISDLKSELPGLDGYQKVPFTKRSPFGSMPGLNVVPGLTVDVKINGATIKDVLIDLGSTGGLTLPRNEQTNGIFKNELKQVAEGISSFGLLGFDMDTIHYYKDVAFNMGNLRVEDHSIDIYNRREPLLGTAIFSHYSMIIDFKKNDLYFKPVKADSTAAEEKLFGFNTYYDAEKRTCIISNLYEGSAAKLSGLQLNDTVIQINGEPVPIFTNFCEFRTWSKKCNLEEKVTVKITRKEEVFVIEKAVVPKRRD